MAAIDLTRTVTGAVLQEMRDAAGLSLIVMAERGGCPRQHLARVESGERPLTRDIGRGISRVIAARTIEMRAAKRDLHTRQQEFGPSQTVSTRHHRTCLPVSNVFIR